MLLVFDVGIGKIDLNSDRVALAGIANVIQAYRNGFHFLLGSRATLESLLSCELLGELDTAALKTILSRYSELGALKSTDLATITFVAEGTSFIRTGSRSFQMTIQAVAIKPLLSTALLAENTLDSILYGFAGEHYRIHENVKLGCLSLTHQSGGGSQIATILRSQLNDKERPVVCITDGDRWHVDEPDSPMSRACSDEAMNCAWPCEHLALKERELENVIPSSLIAEAIALEQREAFDELDALRQATGWEAYAFADLKEGTRLHKLLESGQSSSRRVFWLKAAMFQSSSGRMDDGCVSSQRCREDVGIQCAAEGCRITKAIGQRVSEAVERHVKAMSLHESWRRAKTSHNLDAWLALGKVVFEWCASPAARMRL